MTGEAEEMVEFGAGTEIDARAAAAEAGSEREATSGVELARGSARVTGCTLLRDLAVMMFGELEGG